MAGSHTGAALTRRGFLRSVGVATAMGSALASGASVAQAGVVAQSKVTGKFQAVTVLDFHPDHNKFLQDTVKAYAASKGWELDLSDLNAFQGGTDVYQKLQAQKAAGQPVDLMITHSLDARLEAVFDLTRDASDLVQQAQAQYGKAYAGAQVGTVINGKWMNLPYYVRGEGYWLRKDKFAEVGIDTATDPLFNTWDGVLAACRQVARPDQKFYGWGNTVNTCGDGEYNTQDIMFQWGGALADPTGQIVTLYSPETIDAMTWLTDVFQNPANQAMLPPGINSWNDTGNNEAWLAGSVAFTFNAATLWAKSILDGTKLPDGTALADVTDVVMAPLGPYGARQQRSSGAAFHFMNGSKNNDAAVEVAQYMLTPQMMRPLYEISYGYVLPAYFGQWDEPFILENKLAKAFKSVAFLEPPFIGLPHRGPPTEAASAVSQQNVMTNMMGEILAGKPVAAAVRDAHLRAVDIYQSFGLKGR